MGEEEEEVEEGDLVAAGEDRLKVLVAVEEEGEEDRVVCEVAGK